MPARDISAVPLNLPPKGNADTRGLFSGSVAGGLENVKKSGEIAPTVKEVAGKDAETALKDMASFIMVKVLFCGRCKRSTGR